MSGKFTKEICIVLLRAKADELRRSGEDRLPRRSDFPDGEVSAIKAFLGPWPRALEAVGIKEPNPLREQKKLDRRERQKANRIRYKKEHPKENKNEKENCVINIDGDIID